jgi:hypothetical protein
MERMEPLVELFKAAKTEGIGDFFYNIRLFSGFRFPAKKILVGGLEIFPAKV